MFPRTLVVPRTDPGTILHVGLPPGRLSQVHRIDQDARQRLLQDVECTVAYSRTASRAWTFHRCCQLIGGLAHRSSLLAGALEYPTPTCVPSKGNTSLGSRSLPGRRLSQGARPAGPPGAGSERQTGAPADTHRWAVGAAAPWFPPNDNPAHDGTVITDRTNVRPALAPDAT